MTPVPRPNLATHLDTMRELRAAAGHARAAHERHVGACVRCADMWPPCEERTRLMEAWSEAQYRITLAERKIGGCP
jgi:hypothetical protein